MTAYVDPDDPSEAYLIDESIWTQRYALGALGVGLLTLVFGGLKFGARLFGVESALKRL